MQTGPRTARTASRCSGSSPASTSSGAISVCGPVMYQSSQAGRTGSPLGIVTLRPWIIRARLIFRRSTSMADSPEVTMFSTSWCGYCKRLKKQLEREGIGFAEVDIEADEAAASLVEKVNGGNQTVPTLLFRDGSALTNPSIVEVKAKLAA